MMTPLRMEHRISFGSMRKSFPDIIKPQYQAENQYSKGKMVEAYNYFRAEGRYIALCEGDDYWTDPQKLQKQVDFLDELS